MTLAARVDAFIHSLGPWGYPLLGAAAMIEYLFPLFPGDTVTLLGGVYASRGERPWSLVLLVVTLGSVLGAGCDYGFGRILGKRLGRPGSGPFSRRFAPEKLEPLLAKMRRRGTLLLLANRFLPGIRPFLFVAAGAAGMPLGRVLFLGTISALVWNGGLIWLGVVAGGNAERLLGWVERYQLAVMVGLVGLGLALLLRWAVRARRA